jgi:hypothetical protein
MAHSNIAPSPGRPGATVRFNMPAAPQERVYPSDDADFTYWQAREGAYRTLSVWDELRGGLGRWQHGASSLRLEPNSGIGLQAIYDRQALRFSRWEVPTTLFVASSVDAVAHEVGHAILDAIRPDLWNSPYPEILAFHEAFGDCMALLVALFDDTQRGALFNTATPAANVLDGDSSITRFAESVAVAYGLSFPPNHASATARNADNALQWAFPHELPPDAPGAGLSSEPHSFSRIFTGCFFDCIRNIYKAASTHTTASLRNAALTAGQLLIEATENAPQGIQYFRSIAQAMVLADREDNNGAHQQSISAAFQRHGILLGSSGLIAPALTLDGTAPGGGGAVGLVAPARRDLQMRAGASGRTRFRYRKVKLGARRLLDAAFSRDLDLGRLHKRLKAVKLQLNDSVLVDVRRRRYRVMDALPDAKASEEQAFCMIKTLLRNGMLMLDGEILDGRRSRKRKASKKKALSLDQPAAFSVRKRGGGRYVTRLRCICQARSHSD